MTYISNQPWALYNEIDPYAADWLENLIAAGVIANGIVDRRSIEDLRGDDLRGFRQVHFFAGIGVWSYALRCAGITDDIAVWTGSCPCQPFSAAGKGGGVADERHLWPAFVHLIRECRPPKVYGEQVASKDGLGWSDLVQADMEGSDYALGFVDTCSAGFGAPHIRQRLRFSAHDLRLTASRIQHASRDGRQQRRAEPSWRGSPSGRGVDGLDHHHQGLERFGSGPSTAEGQRQGSLRPIATASGIDWVDDPLSDRRRAGRDGDNAGDVGQQSDANGCDADSTGLSALGYTTGQRSLSGSHGILHSEKESTWSRNGECERPGSIDRLAQPEGFDSGTRLCDTRSTGNGLSLIGHNSAIRTEPTTGPTNGFWRDADWLFCRDGKWRAVEPGTFPLVDGSAFRVGSGSAFEGKSRQGMLKAYGNAVDAEATREFIEASLERETLDLDRGSSFEDLF